MSIHSDILIQDEDVKASARLRHHLSEDAFSPRPRRTYSESEVRLIAVTAALEALARFSVMHPLPTCVTVKEAAKMLRVSQRTIIRMKLPRNRTGRIPYEELLKSRTSSG